MNAPLQLSLADRILAGSLPEAEYPLWEDKVWIVAAQSAIDCEDESELRWMIDRQDEADREERALRFGDSARHNAWMIERALAEPALPRRSSQGGQV